MKLRIQKVAVKAIDYVFENDRFPLCWGIFYQPSIPKKVAEKYKK